MNKMPKLTHDESVFAKGVKAALNVAPSVAESGKKPKVEITIREADNGAYIVRSYETEAPYGSKEIVYTSVDELHECIDKKFGGKKKKAD